MLAYNRATDFTTDRRPILEVPSRFKAANDLIESTLEQWYSGPPGNSEDRLPGHVQPFIDDVFAGPHATRFRQIRLRSLSERSCRHTWAISALRNVSEHTGGRAFAIDHTTRSGYLLGYVPEDLLQDGAYRRIEVKVARKGARVLYRRGYYARAQLIPYDRR